MKEKRKQAQIPLKLIRPDPTSTGTLRRRIYAERKYSHVYMLSLSTRNIYKIHNKSSINKYKNTYKRDQWS